MNHQEEETNQPDNLASAEEANPGACFPDCELEDLQSTAGIIPIPVIVNVLGAEEILSEEAKQETIFTQIEDLTQKLNNLLVTEAEVEDHHAQHIEMLESDPMLQTEPTRRSRSRERFNLLNHQKYSTNSVQSYRDSEHLADVSQTWSRKDFVNFPIEEVWKEMEEINKSRLAASKAFKEFQNNFFERKELVEEPNGDSPYPETSTMTPKRRNSYESM